MTTIRITEQTRATLRELAQESGESIQEITAKAVEQFRRQRVLAETNAAYARLRDDSTAWESLKEEYEEWEETLADGLEGA